MKLLWLMILMSLFSHAHAESKDLIPTYKIKAADFKKGYALRNDVYWQTMPCSQQNFVMRQKKVHFPVFQYKQRLHDKENFTEGYYCWKVKLPKNQASSILHFRLIRVFGDVELNINGESIWRQFGYGSARIFDVLYQVPKPELLFQLRLICGESHMCGFRGGFKINRTTKGLSDEIFSQTLDFFAFAGIMFCCFFHSIFIVLRRRSGAAVSLTFVAIALGMRILLTGQGQLVLFTRLDESQYWRFEIFTLYILMPSVISMVRGIFPADLSKPFVLTALCLGGVSTLCLPFFSSEAYLYFLGVAYLLIVMTLTSLFRVTYLAFRNKRSASYPFLACTLIITLSTAMEVANNRFNVELNPSFHPMGYFFSITLMAVLLATRITEAFARVEHQEKEILNLNEQLGHEIATLDQKIYERTAELQQIIGTLPTGIINITRLEGDIWKVSSQYSQLLSSLFQINVQTFVELEQIFEKLEVLAGQVFRAQSLQKLLKESQRVEFEDISPKIRKFFPTEARLKKDGRWIDFRIQTSFVYHQEKIAGIFIFFIDISSLKELEAASVLAEKAREEALAKVAHRAKQIPHLQIQEFLHDPLWVQLGPTAYQQFLRELQKSFVEIPEKVS